MAFWAGGLARALLGRLCNAQFYINFKYWDFKKQLSLSTIVKFGSMQALGLQMNWDTNSSINQPVIPFICPFRKCG